MFDFVYILVLCWSFVSWVAPVKQIFDKLSKKVVNQTAAELTKYVDEVYTYTFHEPTL